MISKDEIASIVQNESIQAIIKSEDFFFQIAQDLLKEWLNLKIKNEVAAHLLEIKNDYKLVQQTAKEDTEVAEILNLLFKIISYCDYRAKDKILLNEYEDKRILARAMVRMGNWINHIILLKLDPEQLPNGSTKNAFNYLLNPRQHCTILSEDHRKMVAENLLQANYSGETFIQDLMDFFAQFSLSTRNEENLTHLTTRIVYALQDRWLDEVVALMASDGTGWQDDHIKELGHADVSIIWNSKKPKKTQKSLKSLRKIIDQGESFELFYAQGSKVRYKANIIDFVTTADEYNKKQWHKDFLHIHGFNKDFSQYADQNKKAHIVFLCDAFERIHPIDVNEFSFYDNAKPPRQYNLSPVKSIPDVNIMERVESDLNFNDRQKQPRNPPLNQILYGPPGTGKTYHTIDKAVQIAVPKEYNPDDHTANKRIFDRLIEDGQVAFITFHQSLSYEDFIEGLKPIEPDKEGERVIYKVVDGLFKEIAQKAATPSNPSFEEAYAKLIGDLESGECFY